MTKELRKTIMQCSRLRNRLNKFNTIEASDNYRTLSENKGLAVLQNVLLSIMDDVFKFP